MNVVDTPQRATSELYREAAARYAAIVKSRAIAVHQIEEVAHPGLSDIALLVVTDHVGVDNRFFFSALQRLPQRHHRLLLREPFILPPWSLRVMRYTKYRLCELLTGRQALQAFLPSDDPDERWCRTLEAYCTYAAFADKTLRMQLLKGREMVAAAIALQSALTEAAVIAPEAADESYAKNIDAACRTFFEEDADPVERVGEVWALFSAAFNHFDGAIRRRLDARSTEEAVTRARALLHGDEACGYFERDYAFRRARDIDGYRQELASLGFPYGDLFPRAAYPQAVRAPGAAPLLEGLLRNVYRVRRRITEYAG